jgi:hypothetical protein
MVQGHSAGQPSLVAMGGWVSTIEPNVEAGQVKRCSFSQLWIKLQKSCIVRGDALEGDTLEETRLG